MIKDFEYLQTKLDCTSISASAQLYSIMSLPSIDSDEVITISSGVVTESGSAANLYKFLGRNNLLGTYSDADDQYSGPTLTQLFTGCSNANKPGVVHLRDSEVIRICVEMAYTYNSSFDVGGYAVPDRYVDGCYVKGQARFGAIGNTGVKVYDTSYPSLLAGKGYCYHSIAGSTNVQEWTYSGSCEWVDIKDGMYVSISSGLEGWGAKTYGPFFANTHIFGTGHIVSEKKFSVMRTVYSRDGHVFFKVRITRSSATGASGQDPQVWESEVDLGATPEGVPTGNNVTIQYTGGSIKYKTGDGFWPWEGEHTDTHTLNQTTLDYCRVSASLYPYLISTYQSSTKSANVVIGAGTVTVSYPEANKGKKGTYLDPPTISVTGNLTGQNLRLPYVGSPRSIMNVNSIGYAVPTTLTSQTRVPLYVGFSQDNLPTVENSVPTGGQTYGDFVEISVDRVKSVNQCILDNDTVSPFEALSAISATKLKGFFESIEVRSDPYFELLVDNTCMMVCEYELHQMLDMISKGEDKLVDEYGAHFFDNFDALEGQSYSLPDNAFIKDDDDKWYQVTELQSSWCAFANGYLTMLQDHKLQIDYMSVNGLCLSAAASHQEGWEAFVRSLVAAYTDVQTQGLLYSTINGVLSSTAWIADAGSWLKECVDNIRHTANEMLLSLGNIEAITISQRKAILAGEAYATIPATRVADIIDTAASAGADSINGALALLSSLGSDNSAIQIQNASSRAIVDLIISRTRYAGYQCKATAGTRHSEDSYASTFFERTASALLSAMGSPNDGVSSDISDMGVGLQAIYPALLCANITVTDVLPPTLDNAIVFPMSSSYIVVTSGYDAYNYDVSWYAASRGGNDLDVVQDIACSLNEMKAFVDSIGYDLGVTMSYSDPQEIAFTGDVDLIDIMSIVTGAVTGASYGALLGSLGGLVGAGAGAGVGAIIGACTAMLAENEQSDATRANEMYNLQSLSGVTISLSNGVDSTSDKAVVAYTILNQVLGAIKHGAYYPYNPEGAIGTQYPSVQAPGKPYFRYIITGSSQDWSPLILTGFGLVSVLSARTMIKAWTNVVRVPGFLPMTVAGAAVNVGTTVLSQSYSAIASQSSPTYDMQRRILEAVEEQPVAQSGVYQDDQGMVTLRDLIQGQESAFAKTMELIESLQKSIETKDAFITY